MRLFLTLLTLLTLVVHADETPSVLTFREVMMLRPAKRRQYMRDFAQLLILMEEQQGKYEIAAENGLIPRFQVAQILRDITLLPQAHALEGLGDIVPVWNEKESSWGCSNSSLAAFDTQIGTCALLIADTSAQPSTSLSSTDWCGTGTHAVTIKTQKRLQREVQTHKCVPTASWIQLSEKRRMDLDRGFGLEAGAFKDKSQLQTMALVLGNPIQKASKDGSGDKFRQPGNGASDEATADLSGDDLRVANAKHNQKPQASMAAAPSAPPLAAVCAKATPKTCGQLKKDESTGLIAKFKNSAGKGACVRGGFFSTYDNGVYRRGGCKPQGFNAKGASCPKNTEICNPIVFCYGLQTDKKLVPGRICAMVNQKFTANCEAEFNSRVGKPMALGNLKNTDPAAFKKYENQPARACDPSELQGFQENYNELATQTMKSYKQLCLKDGEFATLFCNECNVIGAHLAKMNCTAAAPKPPAVTPSSTPEAPAAKKEGVDI